MTALTHRSRLAALIVLACMLAACARTTTPSDPVAPIATGAKITLELSRDIRLVEDGIRQANASGYVSNDTTATVLRLTVRINQAGLEANKVLRSQTTLAPGQRVSVTTLLSPLVAAIQGAIDQDIVKITNPTTRDQIRTAMLAIQTAIKVTLAYLTPTARLEPAMRLQEVN